METALLCLALHQALSLYKFGLFSHAITFIHKHPVTVQLCYCLPLWLVRFPRITELSDGSALVVIGNDTKHLITRIGVLWRQGSFLHYPLVSIMSLLRLQDWSQTYQWSSWSSGGLSVDGRKYFISFSGGCCSIWDLTSSRLQQTAAIRPKLTQPYRKIYLEYETL